MTVEQPYLLWDVLSDEEMKVLFDPDNKECPFYGYVGNRPAVEEMLEIAAEAFADVGTYDGKRMTDRICRARIRLQGAASAGKTTLVKKFAKLMGLPYIETDGGQVRDLGKLMQLFRAAYEEAELDFEPVREKGEIEVYEAPPLILFIDEVHLAPGDVQDRLLKATESDDGLLILDGAEVDCKNICIIIGTTTGGKLRPAFKTRFQLIRLERHSENQVAEIVKTRHPTLPQEVCDQIADFKPIPREALSLATRVIRIATTRKVKPDAALAVIVKRDGLMSGGMSKLSLQALELLKKAKDGLSKKNLCTALEIEEDEWDNDVLPGLMGGDKHPAYVEVSHRHIITEEGRNFLNGSA